MRTRQKVALFILTAFAVVGMLLTAMLGLTAWHEYVHYTYLLEENIGVREVCILGLKDAGNGNHNIAWTIPEKPYSPLRHAEWDCLWVNFMPFSMSCGEVMRMYGLEPHVTVETMGGNMSIPSDYEHVDLGNGTGTYMSPGFRKLYEEATGTGQG